MIVCLIELDSAATLEGVDKNRNKWVPLNVGLLQFGFIRLPMSTEKLANLPRVVRGFMYFFFF